jgi:hypothetical protein
MMKNAFVDVETDLIVPFVGHKAGTDSFSKIANALNATKTAKAIATLTTNTLGMEAHVHVHAKMEKK